MLSRQQQQQQQQQQRDGNGNGLNAKVMDGEKERIVAVRDQEIQ